MKSTSVDESGVIQIFVPGLPSTPGWVKLSQKKRDELLQITSDVQQFRGMKSLGEIGELMKLAQAKELLEGEEMQMWDYLRQLYPDVHLRTMYRKQADFNEFVKGIHPTSLKRLVAVLNKVPDRFENIAKAVLGDLKNALREVPELAQPASTTQEVLDRFGKLEVKLLEQRQARRKGTKVKKDRTLAEKMATNAFIHYDREAGLETSAERRSFATKVVGWYMEACAVSGSLKNIHRTPIPDGVIIRRGRPKGSKNRRKEAA